MSGKERDMWKFSQELAEKLVELGFLSQPYPSNLGIFVFVEGSGLHHDDDEMDATYAVKDWNVAGAIITELRKKGFSWLLHTYPDGSALMTIGAPMTAERAMNPEKRSKSEWTAQVVDGEDARAIIRAGVDAFTSLGYKFALGFTFVEESG